MNYIDLVQVLDGPNFISLKQKIQSCDWIFFMPWAFYLAVEAVHCLDFSVWLEGEFAELYIALLVDTV